MVGVGLDSELNMILMVHSIFLAPMEIIVDLQMDYLQSGTNTILFKFGSIFGDIAKENGYGICFVFITHYATKFGIIFNTC